jgi:hypothetical protein|tara:strand:- start:722 stop:1042 length:321 start_codon:yes stop_codon:yes gene_type:complete
MKIFNLATEIQHALQKHPVLRDNDNRLIANIWFKRLVTIDELSGKDLLMLIAKGKLPSFESISRCRRKIQQEDKSLRGRLWDERHQIANDIRKEIRGFHLKLESNT